MSEQAAAAPSFTIEAGGAARRLTRAWETAVGVGDAWSLLRADLQAQLRRAARECGFRYLRCHGVLCDQLQCVRREQTGGLVYNWRLVDAAYDALLDLGLRPFVEFGFMPGALASGAQTIFHYRANVTPPADLGEWAALIAALARHWLERYGVAEVRRWYFEVWNEPNLAGQFWTGTQQDYFHLYAATARALKGIDPALRVGGPATSRGEWVPEFLAWCRANDAPVDFVSTHVYPDDDDFAKTDRTYRANYARGDYLATLVARVRQQIMDAGYVPRPELHWTEWNVSWRWGQPVHDSPNLAAFICQAAQVVEPLVESFAFWTLSDIFNEFLYPDSEFVGGFGLLTSGGLPKPGYHAYRLLHRLGDEALPASQRGGAAVARQGKFACFATRAANGRYQMLLSRYLPPAVENEQLPPVVVTARWRGLPPHGRYQLTTERIDGAHANVLTAWQALGSPANPTPSQRRQLQAAAPRPEPAGLALADAKGELRLTTALPPASVAYYELTPVE